MITKNTAIAKCALGRVSEMPQSVWTRLCANRAFLLQLKMTFYQCSSKYMHPLGLMVGWHRPFQQRQLYLKNFVVNVRLVNWLMVFS